MQDFKKTLKDEVDELEQLFETHIEKNVGNNKNKPGVIFQYIYHGYCEYVNMIVYLSCGNKLTLELYDSDNDEREFDETTGEYEPFKTFFKRKIQSVIENLKLLNNLK